MPEQDWMTPDEWERERERRAEAIRRGMERTPEERRAYRRRYQRDWMRAHRFGTDAPIVGWLHELACAGNHKGHKACKPMPCYDASDEVAA
jgi:hypothetical protein